MGGTAELRPGNTDAVSVTDSPALQKVAVKAVFCCLLTSVIPVTAAWFAFDFVDRPPRLREETPSAEPIDAMCAWDGGWYAEKRWLTGCETVASLGLLLIPYVSQGYRNCMASQARFALGVFPAMIVLAIVFERLPRWCRWMCLGMSGAFLAACASLFYAGYWFI